MLRQHIPDYVDVDERFEAEIETVGDISKCPWLHRWEEDPNFSRWSRSDACLMAEMRDGSHWVVAYMDPVLEELPVWVESDISRKRREAWNRQG
jgi:hypothetical protein